MHFSLIIDRLSKRVLGISQEHSSFSMADAGHFEFVGDSSFLTEPLRERLISTDKLCFAWVPMPMVLQR